MKKFNLLLLVLPTVFMTFFVSVTRAQEESPSSNAPKQNLNQIRRPNLLAELNLSPDQIQQIRRLNREKQPLIREAQRRVREANRNLDAAIYADIADESEIRSRLTELQSAQAEVHQIRTLTEFEVRKTLNNEQLVKFRNARRQFKDRIENSPKQRKNLLLDEPKQKLFNRQRRLRQIN